MTAIRFLLTPLREGRREGREKMHLRGFHKFLLTPLREGRRLLRCGLAALFLDFYSRPCGRGDLQFCRLRLGYNNFYSRPCGRGDTRVGVSETGGAFISTHAPAGGATRGLYADLLCNDHFYSRPCGRGDDHRRRALRGVPDFYSRPCGRGDADHRRAEAQGAYFYSRPCGRGDVMKASELVRRHIISTHAPAGGAT